MATPLRERKVALEVDLPQLVGRAVLKALPGLGCNTGLLADAAVAPQDRVDGAGSHLDLLFAQQQPGDLAPAPGRLLRSQCQHRFLQRRGTAPRAARRPGASVTQRPIRS